MTRQKRILIAAIVAAIVLSGLVVAQWWRTAAGDALIVSGTIEATEAQLGFQVPGRIDVIGPREGDDVEPGQILAQLDTRETEARLAQARAQIKVAAARLAEAVRDADRSKVLLAGSAIAREAYDKSALALSVAAAEHAQARANAQALEAVLANMIVRTNIAGIVTVRHREPGEIVAAGMPVLTVMNPADRWVRIYIPENRIGAVRLKQRAAISTDTYPDRRYGGEVVYIASQAEFTPKNVQTSEERVKLVYAVKVRINDDPRFELKPGMPADVTLEAAAP